MYFMIKYFLTFDKNCVNNFVFAKKADTNDIKL